MFRTALPDFVSLREFQWIGYPELRAEMVQAVFTHHPNIQSLGLMYAHPSFIERQLTDFVATQIVDGISTRSGYPPSIISAP